MLGPDLTIFLKWTVGNQFVVSLIGVTCDCLWLCLCQLSLCTQPLRELSNPGASGSIFYISEDDEFIIKTVQHKEAEFLQKLLPGYYMVFYLTVKHWFVELMLNVHGHEAKVTHRSCFHCSMFIYCWRYGLNKSTKVCWEKLISSLSFCNWSWPIKTPPTKWHTIKSEDEKLFYMEYKCTEI